MTNSTYSIGKQMRLWRNEEAQTFTFIVTEDCNLRCKYCYITHKKENKVMTLDIAKKFIDYILTLPKVHDAVIIEFIGGEPLLEVKLIDQICDYFKIKTYEENNSWFWNYRINICTNGINYNTSEVQNFIEKNKEKLSLSITLDGIKEKHDMQRVFPDGSGSFEYIIQNIPLWKSQFPANTKVTFSSDDLPLLKDSVVYLWELGIKDVNANVVFEDVWKENDDVIFEKQIKSLADYIIENNLYNDYTCSLIDEVIGRPYNNEDLNKTSCGAGKMMAVNALGDIYPCIRYYDYSLNNREGYIIGNVYSGIDLNKIRVFGTVSNKYQCDTECKNCEVAVGCMFCQGFGYDEADTPTNFQRAKYICKMHKARVRANNYYFNKLKNIKGITRDNPITTKKEMLFILSDDYISFCSYNNAQGKGSYLNKQQIMSGLKYAAYNFYSPIFVHGKNQVNFEDLELDEYDILHIISPEQFKNLKYSAECIVVFNKDNVDYEIAKVENIIFSVMQNDICNLSKYINKIIEKSSRINIKIQDINDNFPYKTYKTELFSIKDSIEDKFRKTGELVEVNVLTDNLLVEKHEPCLAGKGMITYTPDGALYICPAYYSSGKLPIGNIDNGYLIKNQHLYTSEYAPLCENCDTFQCEACVYLNEHTTNEVNVSPDFQCKKAHIERVVSFELQKVLGDLVSHKLKAIDYDDPYMLLVKG